jgi:hypothetical protein
MTSVASKFGYTRLTCLAAVIGALMLSLLAGVPGAQAGEYSGHLPGKTWTTNGVLESMGDLWGKNHSAGAICVAPAEYSGSWSFPLGWTCAAEPIMGVSGSAYPAVDNPNSPEISFTEGWF